MTERDNQERIALSALIRLPTGLPEHPACHGPWRCELCGDPIDEDRRLMDAGTDHCNDCAGALSQAHTRGHR